MDPDSLLTLPEQIVRRLRKEIHSGKFETGESLKEVQLAQRFNLSRGPIRQALFQLTKEGLLESKANVGVKVAPKPNAEIYNLIVSMRKEIEAFVLVRILKTLTKSDFEILDMILASLHKACSENDVDAVFEHDFYFHEYLIKSYGDEHILAIWRSLISRMMMQYSRFENLMDSYKEHSAIVEAIKKGNVKRLLRLLEKNIQ